MEQSYKLLDRMEARVCLCSERSRMAGILYIAKITLCDDQYWILSYPNKNQEAPLRLFCFPTSDVISIEITQMED
jgi:hypothetical protein